MFCGRSELGHLAEVAGGPLVVVDDVEPLAAVRAGEHGSLERVVVSQRWQTSPVAHERVRCLDPVGPCGLCAHAGTWNDTPGHGVCAPCSVVAERDPQLLGEVRSERAERLHEQRERIDAARPGWPGSSSPSRAITRFSKSLIRSNRRMTLRTALCISRLSMSSVILSTAVLAPLRQFQPQVLGRVSDLLAVLARPVPRGRAPARRAPAASLACEYSHTCVEEPVAAQHRRVAPVERRCGRAA